MLSVSFAQRNAEDLIAASQSGGSPTFFKATGISKINPGTYNNPAEINIRKGLYYFFEKAKEGKPLRIAYIGGSITQSKNQYRTQSFDFIQSMFPNTAMTGINAGISGTDTELGACRIYDQVLKHNPDLIFIEFAVNGGYPQGMEGMVRQIIKHNSQTDICFIYTLMTPQFKYYQQKTITPVMQKLEEIAAHYNIPSVHMGMEATEMEQQGKLIAKGKPSPDGVPVFSADGVHPLETGGNLYAAAIARSMLKMKDESNKEPYKLPKALHKDNWEEAKMIEPEKITFSDGWQKTERMGYKSWFPYIMTSEKSGDSFTFKYKGKAFGIFDIGAPETGQLDVYVDGKQVKLRPVKGDKLYVIEDGDAEPITRFNQYCNNRTRGQYFLVQTPEGGTHTVTFKISQNMPDKKKLLGPNQQKDITANPQKYNHNRVYIGKILLNGELLP